MKVETLLEPSAGGGCEDALLVSRRVYGVFDGVAAGPFADDAGRTGGALAADIARSVFGERTNAPLTELVEEANRRIAQAMEQHGIDSSKPEQRWGTTAAVVRFERDSFEWALVGDSVIIVVYADGSATPVRPPANTGGVLDGHPTALVHLQSGRAALAGVRHVLLSTDGLLAPERRLAAPIDVDSMVRRFLDGGLSAARPEAKDDVAAIAISFPPPAQPLRRPRGPKSARRMVGGGRRSSGVPSRRRRGPRSS